MTANNSIDLAQFLSEHLEQVEAVPQQVDPLSQPASPNMTTDHDHEP